MAFSQNGLLAEGSGVYHVSSPGLHPRTRQTLPAKDVSRAAKLQRQALQAEVEEIWDQRSRRGEISAHMTGTNSGDSETSPLHWTTPRGLLFFVCSLWSVVKHHGNNHQNKFSLKSQGHSNTEYMNRVLCLKKKPALKWTSADTTNRRFTTIAGLVNCITKESRLSGSQQSVMAVPVKWQ